MIPVLALVAGVAAATMAAGLTVLGAIERKLA